MSSSRNYHSSEKPLCRYFASNICFKGEDCQFSHNRNALPDMVCKYYVQGTCSYGNRCRYDHIRPNREATKHNKALLNKTSSTQSSTSNKLLASLNTPNIVTKLSANSKSFVPVSSIKINNKNPWQNNVTTSLNNFHENLGQELDNWGTELRMFIFGAYSKFISHRAADLPIFRNDCPNGDFCQFIHGLLCEMCGLNVLHPHNENQRKIHHRECLADHEEQMEKAFDEAKSAKMQCGICMEMIVEKGLRFGILQNCAHCYCLDCIRKWRKHTADEDIKTKTVRSCPECRIHSDYVIPSKIWIDGKAEKSKLVQVFKENTKKIQCKYIVGGNVDKCPFGNKCFYKHQLPDGTVVEGKSPTTLRKERRHTFDLFDFIFTSSNNDDDVYTGAFSPDDDDNFDLWWELRAVEDQE